MDGIRLHATITKYSHHFTVRNARGAVLQAIYKLSAEYTQHGLVFDKRSRKKRWLPIKTFGIYVDHGREFRFHIGQFSELMALMERNYVDPSSYEVLEVADYEPEDIEIEVQEKYVLREDQDEAKAFVHDGGSCPLLLMGTGTGKAQPLTAKVKVPGGWKQMGEIVAGSYVTARNGKPTLVTGVFPKGSLPIYRIVFEDGRSTECCLDHLWRVHSSKYRDKVRVIKTLEISRLLKLPQVKDRLYVDLPEAEDCLDVKLPMDPYTLGLFLGDGNIRKNSVFISTPDKEITDHLTAVLPAAHKLRYAGKYDYAVTTGLVGPGKNLYVKAFQAMDLCGKRSWEKHIPAEFLHGSRKQRLSLVQGLLDTDGTVDGNGTVSYTSTSKELADGMVYLIRSLGGLAKTSSRVTSYTHNGEKKQGKLSYTVIIRHKKPSELFRLTRKKELTNDNNQYAATLKLRIRSIEFVGHKDAQCISVADKEHLYITDDFIVTHNTVTSLVATAERKKRFDVRVQAMYIDKWVEDIQDILKIDKSEICVIQGGDALMRATNYPASGLPMPKAFVISMSTMNAWYKLYEEDMNNPLLEAYACLPYDFCEHLGIGTEIYDEAHQHPHSVYRNHVYTHVPKIITLTATLLSKDPILRKVQSMMFPRLGRFDKIKMKQYITAHACAYQIVDYARSRLQTSEWGQTSYSHIAFERSILKHNKIRPQYLDMITDLAEKSYYNNKVPGDRLLIFVSTKFMVEAVVEALKIKWPELDIRKYLQENDYADILEPDICVTTIISGGTAIDIKNLRHSIMTISVDSPIANVQALGRLRELKHRTEDADTHFHYLYCSTIPKQKEYHENKVELFKGRVLDHKQEFLGTIYP